MELQTVGKAPQTFALTPDERKFFAENGYFGPFKVYEPDEVTELWKRVRPQLADRTHAIYQHTDINYDRHLDIPELADHVSRPQIVHRLQSLIGADVLCWRTEFFSKVFGQPPTEWHQVESYTYGSGKAALVPTARREQTPMELTVWTGFTEATVKNGCLKVMPGSHKVWYFDEGKAAQNPEGYRGGEDTGFFGYNYAALRVDPNWTPDESKAVPVEIKPGEAVIFTARCMHGSYPNTERRNPRIAFTSRYTPTDVRVYPDPDNTKIDQESFDEHGQHFDLSKFGSVVVGGKDEYRHNRIVQATVRGHQFKTLPRLAGAGTVLVDR